jgi:hypothetical protein
MYINIYELLLIMLAGAFFVLLGAYFTKELLFVVEEEAQEPPRFNMPIAPIQEIQKKKKDEDDAESFY